jgi:putative FmdB family regulatory protein
MPIYEYKCDSCNKQFEVFQKFSDSPLSQCECGGPLRKLISNTSFVLKGTGWYKTDHASSSQKKTTETEKPSESEPKKDDSKKNEAASNSSTSAA